MPIQILPETLVNQIAAGEVIVRPANAVKELVENSLDAGAKRIRVTIANGGRDIRVADNGEGMSPEDAALALVRHATSKIRTFDDLWTLSTRGFRGEALASIAAVARVRLLTRRRDDLAATQVLCEGGSPPKISQAGAPPGTDIDVRDLFFNTPARLKFLKSAAAETTAILTMATRLAIARPDVAFHVAGADTTHLDLPADEPWNLRIARLLGIEGRTAELLPVSHQRGDVSISGFLAPPSITGSDRRRQHFLLDGRPFSSRSLSAVVQEAFKGHIMTGRFPWFVLDIRVAEGAVDLNVHPAKEEVRFQRETVVASALFRAVQETLQKAHVVPEAEGLSATGDCSAPPRQASSAARPEPPPMGTAPYQPEMIPWSQLEQGPARPRPVPRPEPIDLSGEVTAAGPRFPNPSGPSAAPKRGPAHPFTVLETPPAPDAGNLQDQTARTDQTGPADPSDLSDLSNPASPRPQPRQPQSPRASGLAPPAAPASDDDSDIVRWLQESGAAPEPLGQVAECYIVARAGDTLLLVDQHAAHERVMYARLSAATAPVPSQPLLIPLTIDVPPEIVPALHQALPLLAWFGFDASHFGGQTFVVQSTPSDLLPRLDPHALLQDLLEDLARPEFAGKPNELQRLRDRIITRMACRSAIKAGQALHMEEMAALLRDLATTPLGTNCPHGRPTMVTLARHTLDKLFKRIV